MGFDQQVEKHGSQDSVSLGVEPPSGHSHTLARETDAGNKILF